MATTTPSGASPAAPPSDAQGLARLLRLAERDRQPIPPITERLPGLAPRVAYDIQQALVGQCLDEGARLEGYKLGFTSLAKQAAMGVHEPIHGTLLSGGRPRARAGDPARGAA
ncbi:MAG TPA: hypothetical protein V6D00_05770 [Pantanalinema sp.]